MYLPSHFRETDAARIVELIDAYGFAMLVSQMEGRPSATHLPLLYAADEGEHGTLYGHVARANGQWRSLADADVLAIFAGPHAFVSPSWYAAPGVPTWNYAAVHCYGRGRLIEDEARRDAVLDALIAKYDEPVADPEGPVVSAQQRAQIARGMVAFAIDVTEIQAKFKLSQNRSREDRQRVVARLGQSDDPLAHAVAGLMLDDLAKTR